MRIRPGFARLLPLMVLTAVSAGACALLADVRPADAPAGKALMRWTLLRSLTFEDGILSAVAFSPDGKLLAGGSYNGTIRLWDAASGKRLRTLPARAGVVSDLAFSPDGKMLAAAHDERVVDLWDARTYRMAKTLRGHTEAV